MRRRNLLITGASKGLGREIKNYYIKKNFNLINISRSNLKDEKNLINIKNDLTNFRKTLITFKRIKKKFKSLDAIICCTGSGKKVSNDELNDDVIRHYLDLNLLTIINTINSYYKIFKKKNTKIVIISSIVSKKIIEAPIGYSISKRALDYFIKIFAKKYSNSKININMISPGNIFIKGNNWDRKIQKDKKKVTKYINKEVPLKSFIYPYDILPILDVLISKNANNITGSDFIIDGGQSI